MALTAVTTLNIPGVTQTIVFNNPATLDEIDFAGTQITLKAISTYNLSRSDFLLYFNYLDIYNTALFLNFPFINANINISLLQSEFDIKMGATRLTYDQHSGATDALSLSYQLSNQTMTFAARASDVVISLQEFFIMIYLLRQYSKQVSLN